MERKPSDFNDPRSSTPVNAFQVFTIFGPNARQLLLGDFMLNRLTVSALVRP